MTAYAFGKPVVASNVAGLKEYVEPDSTGLLVPPGDSEQLAEAIIRLLSNNKLRQRLGARAQRWAQEWQESVTKKTVEAYEHAMMAHSTGGREAYANTSNT
jgi:glycosyltransferase involved in cell wall biosynthesis